MVPIHHEVWHQRIIALEADVSGFDERVGSRFQSFGINELEVVGPTFSDWNRLAHWLAGTKSLQDAHRPAHQYPAGFSPRI